MSAPAPQAFKLVGFVPVDALDAVSTAVFATGAGTIGAYDQCSWYTLGTGTFRGGESSTPTVGVRGEHQQVEEYRVEFRCDVLTLSAAVAAFVGAHPYEEPAYDVYALWGAAKAPASKALARETIAQATPAAAPADTPTLFTESGGATLSFDGGSRGNPGPAAGAWVIVDDTGVEMETGGDFLGAATNNVAEYTGFVRGLERALDLGIRRLNVRGDSELIVKQIRGEYKVKNADLKPLHARAAELLGRLDSWSIQHVPRAENAVADALVNATLDAHA